MPQVTAYATYGGLSSRSAQLDFGGLMPVAERPSRTVGSNGADPTAALYADTVSTSAAREMPSRSASSSRLPAVTGLPVIGAPSRAARPLPERSAATSTGRV